jgi:hypothetical protein
MARMRTIKPEFFDDPDIADLTFGARLLFIGLLTEADRAGRLTDDMRRLKVRIFPYDAVDIDALVAELLGKDLIRRYQDSQGVGRIWIRSFLKHQRPHPKEPDSVIEPCPTEASREKIRPSREKVIPSREKIIPGRVKDIPSPSGSSGSSGSLGSGSPEVVASAPTPARAPAWTHQQRGAPLIGNHAGCFHAPVACERGLCVPMKLGQQWRQQSVSDPDIRAFVEATITALPPGAIGDDPFTFWRAAWSAQHGSRAPAKAALPGSRQRAADVTLATMRRGSA